MSGTRRTAAPRTGSLPRIAPSSIPAPLPPWAKALLQLAPYIPSGVQEVLQHIGLLSDSDDPAPSSWMHVQLVGQPLASTERADDFVTTLDIVNITGGNVDSSWTSADTTAVQVLLDPFMASWATRMSNDYRWRETRFYKRSFNPYTLDEPFVRSGPPQVVYPVTHPGTGTEFQAPQVAVTTTDRTPYPRHWGRNYWPHPRASLTSSGGYMAAANVDSWCTAVHGLYSNLMAAEFFPVVVVTQMDKQPLRGLLTVSSVQMDNVFDVVRRRRSARTTYRKVLPL